MTKAMTTEATLPVSQLFQRSKVLPVLVIDRIEDAIPTARALIAGGIDILEITLRTDCALEAISLIRAEFPDAIVGAGTVLTPADVAAVIEAGGQFIVTPGATKELLVAAQHCGLPIIPGVSTVSEAMAAMTHGFTHLKFFPAEANGGAAALKAMAGPLGGIKFCATGGINLTNMNNYLALDCVPCIGGSWLTPKDAVKNGDWDKITALAKEAIQ